MRGFTEDAWLKTMGEEAKSIRDEIGLKHAVNMRLDYSVLREQIMSNSVLVEAVDTLFSFRGRVGRLAFFGYGLVVGCCSYGLIIFSISTAGNDRTTLVSAISAAAFLLALLALWPLAALLIKRLRDLNRSSWHGLWLTAVWCLCVLGEDLPGPILMIIKFATAVTWIWLLAALGSPGPMFTEQR